MIEFFWLCLALFYTLQTEINLEVDRSSDKNRWTMRKFWIALVFIVLCSPGVFAQDGLLERLRQIPQISEIRELQTGSFAQAYQFRFEQPVDHTDPSKGSFKQQVVLGHSRADAPVVVQLEGYAMTSLSPAELTTLFKANQLMIEYRFFGESVPASGIPWESLTIKQAAADQHAIIRAIKEHVYPASPWISTGISKGGQAVIFHRYFYPEDVEISVPYVAPLMLKYVDPRIEKFLSKLGTTKNNIESIFGGGSSQENCHYRINDFQLMCFEHKDKLLPYFEEYLQAAKYTYNTVGGNSRAFDLLLLEFPFAFWQWGNSCEEIPELETSDWKDILAYIVSVSPPDFFDDSFLARMRPFYYTSLTETGMYDYKVKPFKKYLKEDEDINFSFALPAGVEIPAFNEKQMLDINKWLQTDAQRMLFIYGGIDPWNAVAVDLKNNDKCRKYVRGDSGHACRIKDFDPVSREDLIDTLKEWLTEVTARKE